MQKHLQGYRTERGDQREDAKTKLGLIQLKKIVSSNFADQGFAYQEELTWKAKFLFTEYSAIKEDLLLRDLIREGREIVTKYT